MLIVLAFSEADAIQAKSVVEAKSYPAAVLVTAQNSRTKAVAAGVGVLLAPNAVLTAAHMVDGFDAWQVVAPYAAGGPGKAQAASAKVHPSYNRKTLEDDIAVLLLDRKIEGVDKFPVLADRAYPLETKLVVIGRTYDGKVSPAKLFLAESALAPVTGNINLYGGFPAITEKGDSGGPIFARRENEVIAVVTGTLGESRAASKLDQYAPVHGKVRKWILDQVR